MRDYLIVTDSTADLPESYVKEHGVGVLYLKCILDGVVYDNNNPIDNKVFYDKERNGSMPTTSQLNPFDIKEALLEFGKEYKKILYIAFSSGLSGTYSSAMIAADELKDEAPELDIRVVDSKAAALGEGLLVHKAVMMQEEGCGFEEVVNFVQDHALNIIHVFTVDDLNHLYRGGRVSKATAIIGSIVGVKPLLHVDDEGHLINLGTARGRKKSLKRLVDMLEERMDAYAEKDDEPIFIGHGDCLEDAEFVAAEIKKRFGFDVTMIDYVGPVIGSHSGPGTVALFRMGGHR